MTPSEIRSRTIALAHEGMGFPKISKALGISFCHARRVVRRLRKTGKIPLKVPSKYSDDRLEHIRELADENLSGTEIARRLSMTRGAVIGLCYRNGIQLRSKAPSVPRKSQPPAPDVIRQSKPSSLPSISKEKRMNAFKVPENETGLVDIFQLSEKTCRWPYGEQAPFKFCGQKPATRSSYCAEHTSIGINPSHRSQQGHRAWTGRAAA